MSKIQTHMSNRFLKDVKRFINTFITLLCFFELWHLWFPSMHLPFFGEKGAKAHWVPWGGKCTASIQGKCGREISAVPWHSPLCSKVLACHPVNKGCWTPTQPSSPYSPCIFWAVSAMLLSFRNALSADLGGEANRIAMRDDDAHSAGRNEFQARKC